MKIEAKELESGKHDGAIVWVTDHRSGKHRNPMDKPIRNVKPTKCMVGSQKSFVELRFVYFAPLLKNGKPSKRRIAMYDNTGYRAFRGIPLNIFTTEAEAVAMYEKQKAARVAEIIRHVWAVKVSAAELIKELGGESEKTDGEL